MAAYTTARPRGEFDRRPLRDCEADCLDLRDAALRLSRAVRAEAAQRGKMADIPSERHNWGRIWDAECAILLGRREEITAAANALDVALGVERIA